jgi:hypothetical protein
MIVSLGHVTTMELVLIRLEVLNVFVLLGLWGRDVRVISMNVSAIHVLDQVHKIVSSLITTIIVIVNLVIWEDTVKLR